MIRRWKSKYPFTYAPSKPGANLKPQRVVEELDRQAEVMGKEKFIVSTGVGQHQMWAAQFYRYAFFSRSPFICW